MNRPRDIERTLEGFFLDGPTVMPDRIFDAVFDQVERTPQRRFARLHLRLTEMNPRIRLLAVLAAALVAVVAAVALIGGGSQRPVVASPSPSTATTVPAALQGDWTGGPRPLVGDVPGAGSTIWFSQSGFWTTPSNLASAHSFQSVLQGAGENQFRVETFVEAECEVGAIGLYDWSRSAGGTVLTISMERDDCAARGNVIPGTWWSVDCEDGDAACLGSLEAASYASQFFDPFVASGSWRPRYGALSYTVPDGWSNTADWPESFTLAPSSAADGAAIYLFGDVVVVSEEDPCSETADSDVGESAEEIATWLAGAPGVVTTAPTQTTIGDLEAWQLDISIDPAWTTTCPFSEGKPYRGLFTDRLAAPGFSWGIGQGRMRIYLVDLGDGRALWINIEAATPSTFDGFVAEATTIVESFELVP